MIRGGAVILRRAEQGGGAHQNILQESDAFAPDLRGQFDSTCKGG
jgi:hypothetical protein